MKSVSAPRPARMSVPLQRGQDSGPLLSCCPGQTPILLGSSLNSEGDGVGWARLCSLGARGMWSRVGTDRGHLPPRPHRKHSCCWGSRDWPPGSRNERPATHKGTTYRTNKKSIFPKQNQRSL